MMILLFMYLFIYGRKYTMFGEQVPKSSTDKVIKFYGESVKIDWVISYVH